MSAPKAVLTRLQERLRGRPGADPGEAIWPLHERELAVVVRSAEEGLAGL